MLNFWQFHGNEATVKKIPQPPLRCFVSRPFNRNTRWLLTDAKYPQSLAFLYTWQQHEQWHGQLIQGGTKRQATSLTARTNLTSVNKNQ